MTFASLVFLYGFLPVVLVIYHVLPRKARNVFLLLANIVFYGWGEPQFLLLIAFSCVTNFLFGKAIGHRRAQQPQAAKKLLIIAIVVDVALLVVFKYTNFFTGILHSFFPVLPQSKIPLPLGISFYTFHVLSYLIDVYRGDAQAQKSLVRFGTYMSLFPQMVAGPIVRYKEIADQLGIRKETLQRFGSGVVLFCVGLAKKVLLANQMGRLWELLQQSSSQLGVLGAWGGAAAFTFQIYFDFAGYSDMARGLGRMFGFELPLNFNYPYISKSVTEFWRRWHMTLSFWFRDYVYIPLGGSRCSLKRTLFNVFVVWLLTGMWHGANWNFIFWGLYYFVFLALEKCFLKKLLDRAPAFLSHLYTILVFVVGWVLFSVEELPALGQYLAAMFGANGLLPGAEAANALSMYLPLLVVAAIGSVPLVHKLYQRLPKRAALAVAGVGCVCVLLLCTASLISQGYNPDLYAHF